MSARFELYPAIDVRAGRVVRLRQGDYSRETRYGEDPCGLAVAYAAAGAKWLHLVDLDAARSGGYTLGSLVSGIKAATALRLQTGGGVRSEADVQAILDAGADRVVIGSLAVHEPDAVCRWIERYGPERIVVALDTRADVQGQWRLPTHGWTDGGNESSPRFEALLQRYASAGLRHMLCTDIARDGMLSGPNCDLYRLLQALGPSLAVQASGGIRDVADIQAARDAGCAGAVLGRALLEGRLDLAEALTC